MESKESIIEIVQEDILRILGEEGERVSLENIKSKIKASDSFISKSIEKLEDEGLILVREGFLKLTKNGYNVAEKIVKKHLLLENYFKEEKEGERAHKEADLIEHYVSREVLDTLRKLSTQREDAVPLLEFQVNQRGLVTDLIFPIRGTFERIVSMGIFPGEEIKVINILSDSYIISVNNKKFALGRDIVENIKVLNK